MHKHKADPTEVEHPYLRSLGVPGPLTAVVVAPSITALLHGMVSDRHHAKDKVCYGFWGPYTIIFSFASTVRSVTKLKSDIDFN